MLEGLLAFLDSFPEFIRVWTLRSLALILTLALLLVFRYYAEKKVLRPIRLAVKLTRSDVDDRIIRAIVFPLRVAIWIGVFMLLSRLLIPSDLEYSGAVWVTSKLVGLVVALIFIYRMIDILLPTTRAWFRMTGIVIEERLLPFIRVSMKILLITLGIVLVIQELGYDINALLTALGVGGFGLSLAAKDTVANVFGFVSIVGDRPCDVGDYIKTPHGEGIVEEVGIRSTKLRQLDQAVVSIPNNLLNNCYILNWSRLQKRRIDMKITVRYDTSTERLSQFMERARAMLADRPTVQEDSIVVFLTDFNVSSLDVLVRCFVKIADWKEFTAEKERIMVELFRLAQDVDVHFAFNTMSLHVEDLASMPLNIEKAAVNVKAPEPAAKQS
ncbi:MAG TPA: mechanosensitive ion channel family protein [Aggregatilineales bacterium]|nr:mechanosensitive ion channel family protein [Aggregatilineales bacterium]